MLTLMFVVKYNTKGEVLQFAICVLKTHEFKKFVP